MNTTPDLARVEGLGAPLRVADLADLLGHADIRLLPVHDLNTPRRADAYEHDNTTKDHVWLTTGGDVWPYATPGTRDSMDFDHTTPYDPHGPSGQTGTHNSAPLRRQHHRWKTHAGYTYKPTDDGQGYLWTTPHGLQARTDHTGTHRV